MAEKEPTLPGSRAAKRKRALALLIPAALLAGGYAWFALTSPAQPKGPPEQVTIAANTDYAGTCPIFVAQENGYFAAEGLLATIQPHSSGKSALDAALQGRAGLAAVADVPIMFAAMNGLPVSVVATIFTSEKDHGIVGRRDRGVIAPASLKGKRIGVTVGTSGHFVLDAFLNRQSLSPSEVTMVGLKPEEISGALARGEVDAAAAWEPTLGASLEQLGGNGVVFYGEGVYDLVYSLAGTRDYIAGHPGTIERVLRALIRGAKFCAETPEAARQISGKAMKVDPATLKALWPSYRFAVTLDQGLVLALEDETRWAIKNKLAGKPDIPNYLNHVYLDGLRVVAPAAVTVIH